MNVKNLALATILAALYAVLVVGLSSISFQLVQVRVADALVPLSIVFGWPAIIGVAVGCVISNMVSPMPSLLIDITFGAVANFFASLLAWRIGKWKHQSIFDVGVSFVPVAAVVSLLLFSWTISNIGFFSSPLSSSNGAGFVNGALNSLCFAVYLVLLVWVALRFKIEGRANDFLGCLAATAVVTFVVGAYLAVITQMDFWIWWVGIGVGSMISICGIGYPLLQVFRRIQIK